LQDQEILTLRLQTNVATKLKCRLRRKAKLSVRSGETAQAFRFGLGLGGLGEAIRAVFHQAGLLTVLSQEFVS
jgi:hypothetical protein